MKIAILGGGHGCYAAAADLSEAGHDVRLWRRDAAALQAVVDARSIALKDSAGQRDVRIALATPDIGAALSGAALVLIPSPAIAQADIARAMAPSASSGFTWLASSMTSRSNSAAPGGRNCATESGLISITGFTCWIT